MCDNRTNMAMCRQGAYRVLFNSREILKRCVIRVRAHFIGSFISVSSKFPEAHVQIDDPEENSASFAFKESQSRCCKNNRKETFQERERQLMDVTILPLEMFEQILCKRCVYTTFRLHKTNLRVNGSYNILCLRIVRILTFLKGVLSSPETISKLYVR